MNFWFGTMMEMLSLVRITVLRAPICCTCPADARDFHAVADADRPLGQNDQAADEVARDVLQTKADADADRAGENRERSEMNAAVFQHDENADDEHDFAGDLRDGVLQRAIRPLSLRMRLKRNRFVFEEIQKTATSRMISRKI